jgi:predicted enzyme related to lactoylglutathione lyase
MNQGVKTILYPVKDLAQAKALFTTLLGVEPIADAPYYVGFKVDGQDIGLVPNGQDQGLSGPVGFYHVDDIQKTLQSLLAAGAEIQQEVRNVGGGRLTASVKDADGNIIGLLSDTAG